MDLLRTPHRQPPVSGPAAASRSRLGSLGPQRDHRQHPAVPGLRASVAVLCLLWCSQTRAQEAELREALASASTLSEEEAKNTRYLSLATVPPDERAAAAGVVSFVLNSLGDSGAISRPVWVSDTLLRFNLRQFTVSEDRYKAHWEEWERLAGLDYVFHIRTQVIETIQHKPKVTTDRNGRKVTTKVPPETKIRTVSVDAPWVPVELAQELRTKTASIGAVLRVEQWLSAATQPPSYYTLAGIPPTEGEFLGSLGIDPEVIGKLDGDKGANVISGVALGRPRRVVSRVGPLGVAWQTYDVFRSQGDRDAIRQPIVKTINPNTQQEATLYRYDAGEWIASKSNGLHLFALYDAAGKRQDAVPLGGPDKSIARDYSESAPGFDGVVVPMLSCVRCHVEDGLRPIDDKQASLPGLASFRDAHELGGFYNPSAVQLRLRQSRESYVLALQEASQLNSQQVIESLARMVRTHEYELVTLGRAALETGVSIEVAREVFARSPDPHLILLSRDVAVHRDNWTESFATAATLLREAQHDAE